MQNLKENLFNRIEEAELFTNRFASFNKSDYEVLMFTVFLDSLEGKARDYDISISLGIPESKVRSLRVKSQLQYPRRIEWEKEVAFAIHNGTYDPVKKMVTITIEDPSVRNLVCNKIESRYGTVNFSLNTKHLVLPVESFIILAACAEENSGEALKKLNKALKDSKVGTIEKGNFRFLKPVENVGELLGKLQPLFTTGAMILNALMHLVQ